MRKRFTGKTIAALLAMSMLLAGCGAGDKSASYIAEEAAMAPSASYNGLADEGYYGFEEAEYDATSESYNPEIAEKAQEYAASRKLIVTMNISAETENYDETMASVNAAVEKLGGYVENSNTWNYSGNRSTNMTIRVPAAHLGELVTVVKEKGNITNESKSTEDITLQYVDTASRKEALQVEEKRLLELLEQAENMEDLLLIEDKLSNIRYQLQSIESTLRTYDNQVDFSTLYLDIQEVSRITEIPDESIGSRISSGLSDTFYEMGQGFENFIVWFVVALPVLLLWAVIILLVVLLVRFIVRKYESGSEKRMLKKQRKMEKEQQRRAEKMRRREEKNPAESAPEMNAKSEEEQK